MINSCDTTCTIPHCWSFWPLSSSPIFCSLLPEVIKDVVFLVGALQVFQSMYEHIVSRQGVTGSTWDEAEAALFVMSAVAKSLHPQQESVVPLVLQSILQLPDATHIAVRPVRELKKLW